MEEQGNFLVGLMRGTSLSIPLWISFFGWVRLIGRLFLSFNGSRWKNRTVDQAVFERHAEI
jgi:hypothetical protein